MILKSGNSFLVSGKVTKDARYKKVGAKQTSYCDFAVLGGTSESGEPIYVNLKAWGLLAETLKELRKGDAFCGTGEYERNEYNGKVYTAVRLDWGNSPMISSVVEYPASNINSSAALETAVSHEAEESLDEFLTI